MAFTGFPKRKKNDNRMCDKICQECGERFNNIHMGCRNCKNCGGRLTKVYGQKTEEWIVSSKIDKFVKKHADMKMRDLIDYARDQEKYIKVLEDKIKHKDEIIEKLTGESDHDS